MGRIADILSRTHKQYFTGREREVSEFRELLEMQKLSTNVIFLYGPAGQGKTTIIREYSELCRLNKNVFVHLDARDITPSASGFYEAITATLNVASVQNVLAIFEKSEKTLVLFIDTYEKLNVLDNWMREEFLPQLPENVLVVFSGRNQPSSKWAADPGWQNLIKIIQLRNFSPSESRAYLEKRKVADKQHDKILDFTHGHPLALSLVADLFAQSPDRNFSPDDSPDVVQTLLDHFMMKAPSPAHKTALEICALTYITTESLLKSIMELEDASELFEWLKNLSFIENNKWGLYPHDLARESLIADLKWRNPDWFSHLYHKAGDYYINKLEQASGDEQRHFLFMLTYLQRNHPMLRPFYHWEEGNDYWVDLMKPKDVKALNEMVTKSYGTESAKQFKFWLQHPAAQVWVWRSSTNSQSGFVMRININELEEKEKIKDEVMEEVIQYVNSDFRLRKGEVCTVFRFWMSAETDQNISKFQSSVFLFITQYYLTTQNLAVHLLCVANPEFWKTLLNYYGMEHVPSLNHSANNIVRGFYIHDWRKTPPKQWLSFLGGKENTGQSALKNSTTKTEIIILSEAEFSENIYNALKDYYHEKKLENNPLIHSRFVVSSAGSADTNIERISILKEKIDAVIKKIEQSPRNEKFHRVLYRTFINPVGSQEQTAAFLNLPFSTYRRYLKKGVNLVSEELWKEEIAR